MLYESHTLHEQLQTWPTYLPSSLRIKHFAQRSLLTLNHQTISPLLPSCDTKPRHRTRINVKLKNCPLTHRITFLSSTPVVFLLAATFTC